MLSISRPGRGLAAAFFSLSLTTLGAVLTAPAVSAQDERPPVYDEQADALADLIAARERAGKDNKRVLLVFGANWCGWCVKLDGLCKSDRAIGRKLDYEYEIVKVDVGHFDKHMELVEDLGADLQGNGIPYLTVVNPDGSVVVHQPTGPLEEGAEHVPERVLEFLTAHQPEPLQARAVLADAKAKAEEDGKNLLVHLGAPWCGWCHRLEDFLAEPEIAALVAKDFIDVKIDTDRMAEGADLAAELRGGRSGGIPWMVVMTPAGAKLSKSENEAGNNCGYPVSEDEIETFMAMLEAGRSRLTDEEMVTIRSRLEERAHAIEEQRRRAREEAERRRKEEDGKKQGR